MALVFCSIVQVWLDIMRQILNTAGALVVVTVYGVSIHSITLFAPKPPKAK